LPLGVLPSHSSAHLPQTPDRSITRTSVLWGFAGSATEDAAGGHSVPPLPSGLVFRPKIRLVPVTLLCTSWAWVCLSRKGQSVFAFSGFRSGGFEQPRWGHT
jgi:hypothetical protein